MSQGCIDTFPCAGYSVPEECPSEVANLVTRCLSPNPEDRPTAKDVVLILMDPSPIQSSWTTLKAVRKPGEVPGPPIANAPPEPETTMKSGLFAVDLRTPLVSDDMLGPPLAFKNPFATAANDPPALDLPFGDGPVAIESPFSSPNMSELPPAPSLKPAPRRSLRPASFSALPSFGRLPTGTSNLPPLIPARSLPQRYSLILEASQNSEVSRSDDSLGRYFEDALAEELHALRTGVFEHDVQGSMMYDNSWQLRSAASRPQPQPCGPETAEDLLQLRIEVPAHTTSGWPTNPFAVASGLGFPKENSPTGGPRPES
jgi:hypothetical protein